MTRKPRNIKGFRKVKIVETGEVYNTVSDLVEAIGGDRTCVSKVLRGKRAHHLGYTFVLAGKSDPEPNLE